MLSSRRSTHAAEELWTSETNMFPHRLNHPKGRTGPVQVPGASVGDVLAVEVKRINLGSWGYVSAKPTMGVLRDRVKQPFARAIKVQDGLVHFTEGIRFPIRPMIGTIGVAPQDDEVSSFHPGPMAETWTAML